MTTLGELQPVDLRKVWSNEAFDFTPWLRDHPEHLEKVLRIGIEITAAEHFVGPFKVDLFGRDLTHDAVLIVENQLEGTDHSHLGQLVTYAAGTDAATIVWTASTFREEHRQALDWLNSHTDEDTRFFGVQIRVVRIGDSLPAPNFEVVAMPNDWQKEAKTASGAHSKSSQRGPLETVKGTPWTPADSELAAAIWDRLSQRARVMFSALMERPEERFVSTEIAELLGYESPNQVAGVLAWPGIYCKREGKALPFFWETDEAGRTCYWMDETLAGLFRAAVDRSSSSPAV